MECILKLFDRHMSILIMTVRIVLMFTSIICKCGQPVGFARISTTFRSFTNIACRFNTIDLAKHPPLCASFNSECFYHHFTTTNEIFYCNALLNHNVKCFSLEKKNEKKHKFWNQTSTSICYKMHGIKHRLFVAGSNDVYVFLLSAGMVHNLLSGHYIRLGHSYIGE